jgi:Raf kinase inhibitor-like YbhB/YbcL family protein
MLLLGCSQPAPAPPTSAPAPTTAPAAKPAVVASPSPSAAPVASVAASPAASPAVKPSVAPSPSPAAAAAASPSASASPPPSVPLLAVGTVTPGFTLTSTAFSDNGNLPSEYSCAAANGGVSPPLAWSGAPSSARAFALVDQDQDVPPPNGPFTHWVVYNIPANVTSLDANQPTVPTLPNGGLQGLNGRGQVGYLGACPPPGASPHRYTFQLFALDGTLSLQPGAPIAAVRDALNGHVVGQTQLIGNFGR